MEKTPGFETSLADLQVIVKKLESGELALEDALRSFEEGIKLTRQCQEYLSTAETRVESLLKVGAQGAVETKPFSAGNTKA
jgi:exodeoxyribonuclease VII small subunit